MSIRRARLIEDTASCQSQGTSLVRCQKMQGRHCVDVANFAALKIGTLRVDHMHIVRYYWLRNLHWKNTQSIWRYESRWQGKRTMQSI